MGTTPAPTVLVVDDDERFRKRLALAFESRGWESTSVESGEAAIQSASRESPEYAVVDLRMPGMGGLAVLKELKAIDPTTNVVVLTGYGSIATAVEAVRMGATDYLTKPAELDEILRAFRKQAKEDQAPPTVVPSLARTEWEHINRVLTDCGGNISQAARLLGLHRRTLQRKLAKYPVLR